MPALAASPFSHRPNRHTTFRRWGMALVMGVGLGWLALSAHAQTNTDPAVQLAAQDRPGIVDTLRGILGYVRWPAEPNPIRMCVLGNNASASKLLSNGLPDLGGRKIQVLQPENEAGIAQRCDAIFVAANSPLPWRKVFEQTTGQPVLTLCERSPTCATGSMFYLDISPQDHVLFEVDIDAVARSSVRVNPQVLRLGRRPNGGNS